MLTQHYETNAFVPSPADRVFAFIDDHTSLSSHMSKSSWQMGWGRMEVELDEAQGKTSDREFAWSDESLVLSFRLRRL